MSLPYFNFYPRDFEADTSHLTLEEDGAYNRLLRLCWMCPDCSMPDDNAWIIRRMRVDAETFERVVKPVLDEFFVRSKGRVSNARLSKEYASSETAHARRVSAGKMGGNAKALKTNGTAPSNAKAMLKQCSSNQNQNQKHVEKEEANASSKKRGSRLSADWALPKAWGEWAVSEEGLPEADVRREADKFRDYWTGVAGSKGVKLDWLATWRGWIRKAADDRRKSQARPTAQAPTDIGAVRVRPDGARQVYMGNGVGWVVQHA